MLQIEELQVQQLEKRLTHSMDMIVSKKRKLARNQMELKRLDAEKSKITQKSNTFRFVHFQVLKNRVFCRNCGRTLAKAAMRPIWHLK